MPATVRGRLAAIERIYNPAARGPGLIYVTGGCRPQDDGLFEATGDDCEWESVPGGTFKDFEARVLREAANMRWVTFGGLPRMRDGRTDRGDASHDQAGT